MIDLDKIEALASLKLSGSERENILKDLDEIIDYFKVLNEVDTDGIEPLVYTKGVKLFLRKDQVKEAINVKELEKNRRLFGDNFFKVRRIIQ
ncbi:MAG: Asp-tRNA(Asn)/Glu-tRNA(Gln) amidotransferase subunit GatC [Caldisericaceae bacterium]